MPQLVPSQVATPFPPVGPGHAVQDVPHVAVLVFETHCPEQRWKPLLHAMPQLAPLQVAVPFATVGHAVHEVPQVAGLALEAHAFPHAW